MKVFVMCDHDRHLDLKVAVFSSKGQAIEEAKKHFQEYSAGDMSPDIEEEMGGKKYLYLGAYNGEGDFITVEEVEVI